MLALKQSLAKIKFVQPNMFNNDMMASNMSNHRISGEKKRTRGKKQIIPRAGQCYVFD